MRSSPVPTARPAFTLLEMILAATIAVLLLAALYVAMELQLRHAETARDVVEQATLARTLLNRIGSDISPSLGTADPGRFQQSSQPGGGGAGGGGSSGAGAQPAGGTSGNAGTTPSGGGGAAGGSSPSSPTASTTSSLTTAPALLALQGDASSLTLFVSQVPRNSGNGSNPTAPPGVSDQRRIMYWLAGGGNSPLGLARQELGQVTSDDASNTTPPAVTDPGSKLIVAPEVKSLQFQYFDGSNWQDTWDGTQAGSDGVSPIGPPAAVAITIGIPPPGGGDGPLKTYRHVVAILTANGPTQQQQNSGSTSP